MNSEKKSLQRNMNIFKRNYFNCGSIPGGHSIYFLFQKLWDWYTLFFLGYVAVNKLIIDKKQNIFSLIAENSSSIICSLNKLN